MLRRMHAQQQQNETGQEVCHTFHQLDLYFQRKISAGGWVLLASHRNEVQKVKDYVCGLECLLNELQNYPASSASETRDLKIMVCTVTDMISIMKPSCE